jgi:hypothetical protein
MPWARLASRTSSYVDGVEVGEVLTGAAEEGGAVDRGVAARGRPGDILRIDDVTHDELDADRRERSGFFGAADEGLHGVAALDQLLADVGAGEPGATGDEDGAHGNSGLTFFENFVNMIPWID